nr:LysR family transcriptional regulator [Methylobacterium sp. C25]
MPLNWDHLQIFLAVARHGQMLEAGRRLGLNHATVARRLDSLEEEIGTTLFHRRPNGSALTEAGERLMPVAERIEAEVIAATSQMHLGDVEPAGTVRIGAPDALGNLFLSRELGQLAIRYPDLVVELVPLPRTFSLSRREAELAIALDRPTHGRMTLAKLTDYSLGLYAARSYLEREGMPETPSDLSRHAGVTGVDDYTYASALDYAAFLEDRTRRVFRCASAIGQLEAVRGGAGIGILHDFAVADCQELVRVLPDTQFQRTYWLMSHPDSHDARRVAVCREFIVRRFRDERHRFLPGQS